MRSALFAYEEDAMANSRQHGSERMFWRNMCPWNWFRHKGFGMTNNVGRMRVHAGLYH